MGRARFFAVFLAALGLNSLCVVWSLAQPPDFGGQEDQPRGGRRGGGGFGQGGFGQGGFGQGGFGQGGFGQGGFGQGMFPGGFGQGMFPGMWGQGGGRGRGPGMMTSPDDPFALLKNEEVQKELKLTKKQVAQADKLIETYQNEVREQMQQASIDPAELEELSDDERAKAFQKSRDQQEKTARRLNDKYRPRLSKVLKPEQAKRLKQIGWQAMGVMALRGDDLAKALKLTKDQRAEIDEAFASAGKKMRDSFRPPEGGFRRPRQVDDQADGDEGGNGRQGGDGGPGGGDRPSNNDFRARWENMRKMNEDRDAAVLAVLTNKQREQFEELKGEPFDLSLLRPRRGRGGPRGASDQSDQANDRGGTRPAGRRRGQGNSE